MKSDAARNPGASKATPEETPAGVPHHDHLFAGASTLTGAAAGAAVGAIAGPVGVIAGGAIGTAVGAIVGITREHERERQEAHDHELDDDIGVTSGSLGTPEETKRPSREIIEEAEAQEAIRAGQG